MAYLIIQTGILLLITLIIGFVIGWLLRGGSDGHNTTNSNDDRAELDAAQRQCEACQAELEQVKTELLTLRAEHAAPSKPQLLSKAPSQPDDLKKISGVGPKLEGILNELGIYRYQQIADFSPENVAWVNEHLRFKGRIERENWIAQAKTLAKGDQTDFAQRYDQNEAGDSVNKD